MSLRPVKLWLEHKFFKSGAWTRLFLELTDEVLSEAESLARDSATGLHAGNKIRRLREKLRLKEKEDDSK